MSQNSLAFKGFSRILFFFNATAPTEIYPLSLHDALPIYVRAIDLPERFLRPRRADGRAEAAEHVVHAGEVGEAGEAVEVDRALRELLVADRQLAPADHGHALVALVLEQQPQHVAADEPRRAGDDGGARHRLSATPQIGRASCRGRV